MTARMATCRDLSKNEADLNKIREVFLVIQASSTPVSLLLSYFSPSRKTAKQVTSELYTLLQDNVETRRRALEFTSDAIDVLIADGETTKNIVGVGPTTDVV